MCSFIGIRFFLIQKKRVWGKIDDNCPCVVEHSSITIHLKTSIVIQPIFWCRKMEPKVVILKHLDVPDILKYLIIKMYYLQYSQRCSIPGVVSMKSQSFTLKRCISDVSKVCDFLLQLTPIDSRYFRHSHT